MDRAATERAELEHALTEVDAELRTIRLQLEDDAFLEKAKPEERASLDRRLAETEQRRARIVANLAANGSRTTGNLPSLQTGLWRRLAMPAAPPDPEHEDHEPPTSPPPRPVHGTSLTADRRLELVTELSRLVQADLPYKHFTQCFEQVLASCERDVAVLTTLVIAGRLFSNPTGLRLEAARFEANRRLNEAGTDLPDYPERDEPRRCAPPVVLQARASVESGLAGDERDILLALQRLSPGASKLFVSFERLVAEMTESGAARSHEDIERCLVQLSHPLATATPLVERDGRAARLSALGCEVVLPGGQLRPLPFPLILLRGVDGLPAFHLGELLRAAGIALFHRHESTFDVSRTVPGPEFPWGGRLLTWPYWGGSTGARPRVHVEVHEDAHRARVLLSEFAPQVALDDVANTIRGLEAPGVEHITSTPQRVVVELSHPAFALWLARLIDRRNIGAATWQAQLPHGLGTMIFGAVRRRLEHGRASRQSQVAPLAERAEEIEGLLIFLQLGEPALDVLRDTLDDAELEWALQHFSSAELTRRLPRHQPFSRKEMRRLADEICTRLVALGGRALAPGKNQYDTGFSAAQARTIRRTKRLKTLSQDSLLRELRDVTDQVHQQGEQCAHEDEVLAEVEAEIEALTARFPATRRTSVSSRW